MEIRVTIKGIDKAKVELFKLRQILPKVMVEEFRNAADDILTPAAQAQLIKNRSIASRDLYNSFEVSDIPAADGEVGITWGSTAPYSSAVEFGQQPHTPDFSRILRWVQLKMGVSGGKAFGIAGAIFESIKQKGTVAHPFIRPAWEANQDRFRKRVIDRTKFRLGLR